MPHCTKCGAEVGDNVAFCPKCGAPQAAGAAAGAAPGAPMSGAQSGLQENVAGALCYLVGWLTGIIFYLIDRRPFVRFHAAQSIVTFGGLHIIMLVLGSVFGFGLMFGGFGGLSLGFALYQILWLGCVILGIVCIVKAFQGERFKLPVSGDFAEKMAK
jgi:uncharacterized membrane protein